MIFYIDVPIGVLATWMITMFVEDPPYLKAGPRGSVDTIGFSFLALWLSTMQIALDKGQELDWFGSPAITVCIVVSAVSFVAFMVRELTTPFPLVDLSIFRNRNFAVGSGLVALLGALLYGTTAILPLLMQGLLDYSATDAGLALSPRGIAAFLAALLAGRLIGLVGGRTLIVVGFSLMTFSVALLGGINLQVGMPIMLAGFAITFIFDPLAVISMGDLPAQQTGAATGIYNLMRNLGGSLGISLLETFVTRESQKTQDVLVGHFSNLNPTFTGYLAKLETVLASQSGSANAVHQAQQVAYNLLQQQAASLAYVDAFQLLTWISFIGTLLVFLLKNFAPGKRELAVH